MADGKYKIKITWLQRASMPFFAGCVAGAFVACCVWYVYGAVHTSTSVTPLRESDISSSSGYTFTDPLIGLASSGDTGTDYESLKSQVSSYITNAMASDGLSSASVKFGDTLQSEGFTINQNEVYDPASLTKVPLMMAYYYLAQEQPSILSDSILYTGDENLDADEQIRSPVQLIPGQTYSVEALIEHMIRYSDNNAEQLLADHLAVTGNLDVLNSLFGNLGIKPNPTVPDYITVQSYSIFLRVLFNATYLDRDYSEKALKLLSESDFNAGIEAGVPNGIIVSQKFGDARIPNAQGTIVGAELQDCGIVYYPSHPYLLCIMTKGDTIAHLETVIANISQMVFQDVESRYSPDARH